MDKLAERERLLARGAVSLADYALGLEQRVAELEQELAQARAGRPHPNECPYPLFPGKFGMHHNEYLGKIDAPGVNDYAPWLNIVRCAACGNTRLEEPVVLASG